MTKKTTGGKKARWTRAQKLEAKRIPARKQTSGRDERSARRERDNWGMRSTRSDNRGFDRSDRRERDGSFRGGERREGDYQRHDRECDHGGSRFSDRSRRYDERTGGRNSGDRIEDRADRGQGWRLSDDRRGGYQRRDERSGYRQRDDRRDNRGFDRANRLKTITDTTSTDRFEDHQVITQEVVLAEETGAAVYKNDRDNVASQTTEATGFNAFAELGLPESLVNRLARDGITQPFPIQSATIPDALAGRDVLGRGRTGSGKTLSFSLPALTRLAAGGKPRPNQPRAIVLVPTRELAMQVSDALQPLVHVIGLRHKLVAGGIPYAPQLFALERGVDLLIATPGRLIDLMERGVADLSRVEIAVLDEADHMAEMGFLEAITQIFDEIPKEGQRLLFSATLDRGIDAVVERYLTDPVEHVTDDGTASITTMVHYALLIEPYDKKIITAEVANRTGRTLVFVRTKLGADRVASELRDQGVLAVALHGGLHQGQRNKVLNAFKDAKVPVLVATDVAARGIHVDEVGVVLQVDPPADRKDYLHRAGRTARAGATGAVVTLVLPHQRRILRRLLDEVGVGVELQRARPGDDVIRAAGGSTPEGHAISDDDLQRILTPPRKKRGGRSHADRRGSRDGFRGGDRSASRRRNVRRDSGGDAGDRSASRRRNVRRDRGGRRYERN